jgi:hypothetical protein
MGLVKKVPLKENNVRISAPLSGFQKKRKKQLISKSREEKTFYATHGKRKLPCNNNEKPVFSSRQLRVIYHCGILLINSVVRRAKQGASCQVKDLMFQNLASRNYRVLQLC